MLVNLFKKDFLSNWSFSVHACLFVNLPTVRFSACFFRLFSTLSKRAVMRSAFFSSGVFSGRFVLDNKFEIVRFWTFNKFNSTTSRVTDRAGRGTRVLQSVGKLSQVDLILCWNQQCWKDFYKNITGKIDLQKWQFYFIFL